MKFYLHSIGCRLNQSEMEHLGRQLTAAGHALVLDPAESDIAILNTCAVTAEAERATGQQTRRIHRSQSDARIILTGCHATLAPDILAKLNGVTQVVPNRQKERLIQIVLPEATSDAQPFDQEPLTRQTLVGGQSRTRAFVKVQDGCHNRCTFCITTLARGDSHSRRVADVVSDIQDLVAAGYQEAALTGVHLGSYGRDLDRPIGLRELVQAILTHTDIPRLRLSSLEPWDIAPDFFELWDNPRLLPHLHLPLQAGCDRTLRRMARRTSQAAFRQLADTARAAIPDLNLTTDIICGFPGESEADFAESLAYVAELGFSRLHVFTYSARPGTAAANMPGQIAPAEKKERTRRMLAQGQTCGLTYHRRYEGRVLPVLWEGVTGADDAGLRWVGYTHNYIRVQASGGPDWHNRIMPMRLRAAQAEGMSGELSASAPV